jgi:pSer/pThr/pTyr-binding forkhead associated (FHA) protein
VSNQVAEVIGSGLLADNEVTVRTTILLSVSDTIPQDARENIISYIKYLIENIETNEEYKIITFGEQLVILQEFTSDRFDLSKATENIEFNESRSFLHYAINNTIPSVQPIGEKPVYYRTIVITDGIANATAGITREELLLKLREQNYPVDVVAVSSSAQTDENRNLAAIARTSGGRYTNIHNESNITEIASSFSISNIFWMRAMIPNALLDGSTRQIDVSDGNNSLQFDIKVNVYSSPNGEDEVPPGEALLDDNNAQESIPSEVVNNSFWNDNGMIILIGAGTVLLITIIVLIVAINRKSKKAVKSKSADRASKAQVNDKTEMLSNQGPAIDGKSLCLLLRNADSPDHVWDVVLNKDVIVGRDTSCQVCINDGSVSREQCKIYFENGTAMVANISKSNLTQLNGESIDEPVAIINGDKLKCGRVTLIVDSLHNSNSNNVGELNKDTTFVNI